MDLVDSVKERIYFNKATTINIISESTILFKIYETNFRVSVK